MVKSRRKAPAAAILTVLLTAALLLSGCGQRLVVSRMCDRSVVEEAIYLERLVNRPCLVSEYTKVQTACL